MFVQDEISVKHFEIPIYKRKYEYVYKYFLGLCLYKTKIRQSATVEFGKNMKQRNIIYQKT